MINIKKKNTLQTVIILAVSWVVIEIVIYKANYKGSVICVEQLNTHCLVNLNKRQS
jgi:hypothetical protein